MKILLYVFIWLLTISSCSRSVFVGPYRERTSNCGKLVLKPSGTAILTKCGDIMWKEEGSWVRKGDTIKVFFRNQWDNKEFLLKKRKLLRISQDGTITKPRNKVLIEK